MKTPTSIKRSNKIPLFKVALIVIIVFFGKNAFSQGTTISNMDFNSDASYPISGLTANGITASLTSSETFLTYVGTATGSSAFTQNSTAGNAIAMNPSDGANTRYFLLELSGTSLSEFQGLQLYLQTQRSATGATTITIATSTDGTNYTDQGTTITVPTSFGESVVSLTGLDGASTIYIKLEVSGASGTGTLRIDNLEIQGNLSQNTWQTNGSNIYYNSGNVGINNPNPQTALDVTGSINATQNLSVEGNVSLTGVQDAPTGTITRNLKVDGSGLVYTEPLGVSDGSAGSWDLRGNSSTDETINFLGTTDDHDVIFKTNNIERMRITSHSTNSLEQGRVYIGGGDLLADQNDLHGTWDDKLVVKDAIRILDDNTSPSKCAVFGYSNDHTYIESYKITNGDQPPYTQPDDIYMGWNSGANVSISENPSVGTTGGNLTVQHTMTANKIGVGTSTPSASLEVVSNSATPFLVSNPTAQGIFKVLADGQTQIIDQNPNDYNPLLHITHSNGSTLEFLANGVGDITSSAGLRPHFASEDFTVFEGTPGTGQQRLGISSGGGVVIQTNHATVGAATSLSIVNSTTPVGGGYSIGGTETFAVSDEGAVKSATLQGTGIRHLFVDNTGTIRSGTSTVSSINSASWDLGGNILSNPTTEYLGSQNSDLFIASNATSRILLKDNGRIGFGDVSTFNPVTDFQLHRNSTNSELLVSTGSGSLIPKMGISNSVFSANIYLGDNTSGPSPVVMDWQNKHFLSFNNGNMLIGDPDNLPGDPASGYDIYTKLTISAKTSGGANFWNAVPLNIVNPDLIYSNKSIFKVDGTGYTTIAADRNNTENAFDIIDRSGTYDVVNFRVKTNGTVYTREVFVQLTNFPDYVFKPEYKIMPLADVEKYVKENSHLPNVPSAKEVEENGGNLGELQKANMEKTEELYLYIFELNKRLQKLEEENEALKKLINH